MSGHLGPHIGRIIGAAATDDLIGTARVVSMQTILQHVLSRLARRSFVEHIPKQVIIKELARPGIPRDIAVDCFDYLCKVKAILPEPQGLYRINPELLLVVQENAPFESFVERMHEGHVMGSGTIVGAPLHTLEPFTLLIPSSMIASNVGEDDENEYLMAIHLLPWERAVWNKLREISEPIKGRKHVFLNLPVNLKSAYEKLGKLESLKCNRRDFEDMIARLRKWGIIYPIRDNDANRGEYFAPGEYVVVPIDVRIQKTVDQYILDVFHAVETRDAEAVSGIPVRDGLSKSMIELGMVVQHKDNLYASVPAFMRYDFRLASATREVVVPSVDQPKVHGLAIAEGLGCERKRCDASMDATVLASLVHEAEAFLEIAWAELKRRGTTR